MRYCFDQWIDHHMCWMHIYRAISIQIDLLEKQYERLRREYIWSEELLHYVYPSKWGINIDLLVVLHDDDVDC